MRQGGRVEIFHPSCRKSSKNEGRTLGEKKMKKVTMPKKTEREDPLGFFNIHHVAKLQKRNFKKTHKAEITSEL